MPVKTRSQTKQVVIPDDVPRNSKGHPSVGHLTIKMVISNRENLTKMSK